MVRKVLVLDGYDKHFVLFAKGHYYGYLEKRFDHLEDRLRVIVGYVGALDKNKVTIHDVYDLVLETFMKLCVAQYPEQRVRLFLRNIFSRSNSGTITKLDVIREMLGTFSVLIVSNEDGVILEIGEPDPKLKQLLDW